MQQEDEEEDDPLDAFMAGIDKQAKKDAATAGTVRSSSSSSSRCRVFFLLLSPRVHRVCTMCAAALFTPLEGLCAPPGPPFEPTFQARLSRTALRCTARPYTQGKAKPGRDDIDALDDEEQFYAHMTAQAAAEEGQPDAEEEVGVSPVQRCPTLV